MTEPRYDVVIVGAGLAGSILAKVLGVAKKRVLLLEAGSAAGLDPATYRSYVQQFYLAMAKVPNSPYPQNPNAPSPTVLDIQTPIVPPTPDTVGYFVQRGPQPFSSDYARVVGGTTLHWFGHCLRMLPSDFRLRSRYGAGVDWPISYDDLEPYYRKAEGEIGVAADVRDQKYLGITFPDGYVYPMFKIPQSFIDQKFAEGLRGLTVPFGDREYEVRAISTPQGRNGMPNPAYDGGKGYQPKGAVGDPYTGQRCEGNANCIPICPVQAKYNARKTLADALQHKHVELVAQAVASRIEIDRASGRVAGITYKRYRDPNSKEYTTHTARGTIYVIAAHSVETAKLLLASGAASSSGQVGRNLMDHPFISTWGLAPEPVGAFRGPGSTSGIETLRDGDFRRERAAFRADIDNWGWGFVTNSPFSDVAALVNQSNLFGAELRRRLGDSVSRQVRLGFLVEQLPESTNRVTIDPAYVDQLGNYRPIIDYDVSGYTRAGMAAAKALSDLIFQRMGIDDHTKYDPWPGWGYVTYQNVGYTFTGAGHLVGTHRMGFTKADSVVDRRLRAWDHENLYLVGCGSMPTVATSNPSLTMAALSFLAADSILKALK